MSYAPPTPRYIRHEGVWYVRKDHVADQLRVAIESAFIDGMRFSGQPVPQQRGKRGPYRLRKQTKLVEAAI